jgi:uncharacterized protein (TIGR02453 family)
LISFKTKKSNSKEWFEQNRDLVVFDKNYPHGNAAGYFIHIEPENCSVGGGVWQITPKYLKKIWQEIDYSSNEFNKLITTPKFQKTFPSGLQGVEKLKKVPDGYDEANPANELLVTKGFCTKEKITDKILTSKDCVPTIIDSFKTSKPLGLFFHNI